MIIDRVFKPCVSASVDAGERVDLDRGTIRHDDPAPDQEHARLAEGDHAVIAPDQACALRYENMGARDRVIDRTCHLSDDLPWKVGVDAGQKGRRNDRPCHQLIG